MLSRQVRNRSVTPAPPRSSRKSAASSHPGVTGDAGVFVDQLVLERIGSEEAEVGMISLPLPRDVADRLRIDHPASAMHPLGWWERGTLARRALAVVLQDGGMPDTLGVTTRRQRPAAGRPAGSKRVPWTVRTHITKEKLEYTPHVFTNIPDLRGVPPHECSTIEFELLLTYGRKTLALQFGGTEKDGQGGPHYWQNVQVDPLWANEVAQAVRVGGIIYNGDTYLWADVYLLLFANGVAHAAAHFFTTKLHVEGYDFVGLPVIRLAGADLQPRDAAIPADGLRFDLGGVRLNLDEASSLCSAEHPARFEARGADLLWRPFDRTFNPQKADAAPLEWAPGMGRTVRFQFSLSGVAPVIARYRAPSWWYAAAGEPWPGGYLPARGRYDGISDLVTDQLRSTLMIRGRFDAGSADRGNDGFAGSGMMRNYYLTGRPEVFRDALDYCYFWADWALDHRDFSFHQWIGGWGWKTCAYSKFRDLLAGYLETGDPNLQDSVESAAEQYWTWFRTNWPRCTIGRDAFEIGGWAWLWRFFRTEHARDRTRELVRMVTRVLDTRGVIGGQMGAGPHPGYLSSLYMSGVCMVSLLEVAEAEIEDGNFDALEPIFEGLRKAHVQFNRSDVELFPSNFNPNKTDWHAYRTPCWAVLAMRIYPEMARLQGREDRMTRLGLSRAVSKDLPAVTVEGWAHNRTGDNLLQSVYHDAFMLGARATEQGLEIAPLGTPDQWPGQWSVGTPWGDLKVEVQAKGRKATLIFSAATEFPVTVLYGGRTRRTGSNRTCSI